MPNADLVVLLDAEDTRLHVGTRAELIPHLEVEPDTVDATNDSFEFYDAKGNKLVLAVDDGAVTFVQEGQPGSAQPQLVADRIASYFARAQVRLTRTPSGLFTSRLPVMSATLPVTLAAAAEVFHPLRNPSRNAPPPDEGDDYHTYCHNENIAH